MESRNGVRDEVELSTGGLEIRSGPDSWSTVQVTDTDADSADITSTGSCTYTEASIPSFARNQTMPASAKIDGQFHWPGGARAAVSLSYDDALPIHREKVAPALTRLGLQATFYCPIDEELVENAAAWRAIAASGHELGNHSLFHPCRRTSPRESWLEPEYDLCHYTERRWLDEMRLANQALFLIDGKRERTFGNTCCDNTLGPVGSERSLEPLAAQLFIAARGEGTDAPVDPRTANRWNLGQADGDGRSFAELRDEIESAVDSGHWLIYMIHGLSAESHNLFIEPDDHAQLLAYLAGHREEIWTAPVIDVARLLFPDPPSL